MTDFMNQYGAVYGVALLCMLAILAKGMLSYTYHRLIRAAKDMGHSSHRLMKSLRMKFETCYQLKIGVSNVDIFVEKYLCHYRVFGLHLKTWEAFCNLCMLLSMIGSLASAILAMALELDRYIVFSGLVVGVLGNGVVLVFDCLYGIANKREMLRVDMLDFLENIYKPRLENETFHAQMMEEYQQEYFDESADKPGKVVNLVPKESETKKDYQIEFTKEEEEVIRDVIREYMG